MSQTAGISKNTVVGLLIVAIIFSCIVSVGIVSELLVKGQKGDSGANANGNLVQVSGTIHAVQNGTIIFFDSNDIYSSEVTVSGNITNGQYSVLLVGGKSYNVETDNSNYYLLYVPTDVTAFTVNF